MNESEVVTYLTIDGSLRIPDHKPDIKQILQVAATPVITKVLVLDYKIIFYGEIHIRVKYSTNRQGRNQSIHFKVPFADFIAHCQARLTRYAKLSNDIEVQNFFVRDGRLISKFLLLKIGVVEWKESGTSGSQPCGGQEKNSMPSPRVCSQCKQSPTKRKKIDRTH